MTAQGLIYWGKIHLWIEDGCFWGWCPDGQINWPLLAGALWSILGSEEEEDDDNDNC